MIYKYVLTLLLSLFSLTAVCEMPDTIKTDYCSHQREIGSSIKQSFARNITYTGLVFVADGLLVKAHNNDFRSMRTFFKPHFKTTFDNYAQYSPLALTFALKAMGLKSESDWKRLSVNSAISYITMAALVNCVRYTSKEMRPDNSERNSFPSGHTATAFAGATILHKEFGNLSPWYSIGGYTLATLTGLSRIMNNRHWLSDVIVGAGVGIVSTDIGYFLGDIILKGKGRSNNKKDQRAKILLRPSFFNLTIGSGLNTAHLNAPEIYDDYDQNGHPVRGAHPLGLRLKTGRSASFNIEGALFFNDYIGIGGRLAAVTLPVVTETPNSNFRYAVNTGSGKFDDKFKFIGLESSHLGMLDMQAGLFASVPIYSRVRIGTKLLVGNRVTTDYTVDAIFKPITAETEEMLNSFLNDGATEVGDCDISRDEIDPTLYHDHDFMRIKANNTLSWCTGLSVTYAYKNNLSFRVFLDFDHAKPRYTYTMYNRYDSSYNDIADTFTKKSTMDNLRAGVGMAVYF